MAEILVRTYLQCPVPRMSSQKPFISLEQYPYQSDQFVTWHRWTGRQLKRCGRKTGLPSGNRLYQSLGSRWAIRPTRWTNRIGRQVMGGLYVDCGSFQGSTKKSGRSILFVLEGMK